MVAAKRAKFAPDKPKPAVIETTGAKSAEAEAPSLDSLRLQATRLGINVDGRWGAHRLQQEIEARRE